MLFSERIAADRENHMKYKLALSEPDVGVLNNSESGLYRNYFALKG
jgi:hypothetical protein